MSPPLTQPCSHHFTYRQLIECGATWHRLANDPATRVDNLPRQPATWDALTQLATTLLDPLVDHFGPLTLTYAFASRALTRHIAARIAPALDQHAGSELNRAGRLICPRRGLACDFRIAGVSAAHVASFIVAELPFDRLYLYGDDRPLHVSVGPDQAQQVTELRPTATGRLVPRTFRPGTWPSA